MQVHFGVKIHRLASSNKEAPRFIFTVIVLVIASALVLALALAASASPVRTEGKLDWPNDDEKIRPLNMRPKAFATTHQGVSTENRPVVSAAGMQ